jgi:hypothetical protein
VENLCTARGNLVNNLRRKIYFASDRAQIVAPAHVHGAFAWRFA